MKITKTQLKQIIKEEMGNMKPRQRPEQVQGDVLRQIYELIGQARTNKSFGFHPEVTQKVVDAVLKLIQQLPQAGEVPSNVG